MAAREQWWVACDQWADATPYASEDKAAAQAAYLNDKAKCDGDHRYWQSEHAPTFNTEVHRVHRVNIPQEASRVR